MPWDALPDHIDTPAEWNGTDWDNKWQRWLLKFKGWFAYGPRSKYWWAKWRKFPIVLFKMKGRGEWRYERDGDITEYYLSVVQYYTRWHFAIQWPFHVSFHVYWRELDVPPRSAPNNGKTTIAEMLYIRFGARRDSDVVYWFPSIFIGGDFV